MAVTGGCSQWDLRYQVLQTIAGCFGSDGGREGVTPHLVTSGLSPSRLSSHELIRTGMTAHQDWYDCSSGLVWLFIRTGMTAHQDWYDCSSGLVWLLIRTDMTAHQDWYDCSSGLIWLLIRTDMTAHQDWYDCSSGLVWLLIRTGVAAHQDLRVWVLTRDIKVCGTRIQRVHVTKVLWVQIYVHFTWKYIDYTCSKLSKCVGIMAKAREKLC